MCGLFGSLGTILPDNLIKVAIQSMKHRGPDDAFWISEENNIKFTSAAVRLSFQDLQHGRQPFYKVTSDSNAIIASLNGEIYNYITLREDLESKGHSFHTKCDTEILPSMYIEYGENFVDQLDGMFTLSLIDTSKNLAFLYTDFLGQKPLYYEYTRNGLLFSSDLNTLMLITEYSNDINEKCLVDLLKYKSIINPSTVYKNISSLSASRVIKFDLKNLSMKEILLPNRFTRAASNSKNLIDNTSIEADLENLLLNAIQARIDSSVPQAFYLSGGVDSSLVVAMARRIYPDLEFNTFNLEYIGDSIEKGKQTDSDFAKQVAKLCNTNHHTIFVDPGDLDLYLPDITKAYGEPFASVPSMWFVAREMKKYCKYTISGDGADELFGSYFTHRAASRLSSSDVFNAICITNDYTNSFVDKYLYESDFYRIRLEKLDALFKKNLSGYDLDPQNPIKCQLFHEATNLFSSGVLTYVDRLSMAHSLEPRSPFLDIHLWEFLFNLPDKFRIRDNVTKTLLKDIAGKYLPSHIVNRKKEGFVFPLYPYILKNTSEIHARINAVKANNAFEGLSCFSTEYIDKLLEEIRSHKGKAYKQAQTIHALNIIHHWLQLAK